MSKINPLPIIGEFPVAGQDNNVQRFNEIFTTTKNNFRIARDEINQLYQFAIFKDSPTYDSRLLQNNLSDPAALLKNVPLDREYEIGYDAGIVNGNIALNFSAGNGQLFTTSGNVTLKFENFPGVNTIGVMRVFANVTSIAHTIKLPSGVRHAERLSGTTSSLDGHVIRFSRPGIHVLEFHTPSSGTTFNIKAPSEYEKLNFGTPEIVGSPSDTNGFISYDTSNVYIATHNYEGTNSIFKYFRVSDSPSPATPLPGGNPTLTVDRETVDEGREVTFFLTAPGASNGELIPYTLSGSFIDRYDLSASEINGYFVVYGEQAQVTLSVKTDFKTEGTETLTLTLDEYSQVSASVDIIDTTKTPLSTLPWDPTSASDISLPRAQTYTITSNVNPVYEKGAIRFIVTGNGAPQNMPVRYSITGVNITDSDFVNEPRTGNVIIIGNTGSVVYHISNDLQLEGSEFIEFRLDDYASAFTVEIIDNTNTTPDFDLGCNVYPYLNEGVSFEINIDSLNAPERSRFGYVVSGIDAADLEVGSMSGQFEMVGGLGVVRFKLKEDLRTEGNETFTFTIAEDPTRSISLPVIDTSIDPTYTLFSLPATQIDEGNPLIITLVTTNIPNPAGKTVPYNISPTDDISGEPMTGNFVLDSSGQAELVLNISADHRTEGAETLVISIPGTSASLAIRINDTSVAPTPTFQITSNVATVSEGDVFQFTVTTNLDDGEVFDYTITNCQIEDIGIRTAVYGLGADSYTYTGALRGTALVNEHTANIIVLVRKDRPVEDSEGVRLSIDGTSTSLNVPIIDTSPVYNLTSDTTHIYERGSPTSATITLTTRNVPDGAIILYEIAGIGSSDIQESLYGEFTITSSSASTTIHTVSDNFAESTKTLVFKVYDLMDNSIVANSISISIDDEEIATVSGSLTTNKSTVTEGEEVDFILTASGYPDGTVFHYELTGIDAGDIDGSLEGTFTLINGHDMVIVSTIDDLIADGDKTMVMTIFDIFPSLSKSVTVVDASGSPSPTYSLSADKTTAEAGQTVVFTCSTTNVPTSTHVAYTVSGINPSSITTPLTGQFTLSGTTTAASGTVSIVIASDLSGETLPATMTMTIDDSPSTYKSVTITATSSPPPVWYNYSLVSPVENYTISEGVSYTITINSSNAPDGTIVPYEWTSEVTSDQLDIGSPSGSAVIQNGTATVTFRFRSDGVNDYLFTIQFSIFQPDGTFDQSLFFNVANG